MSAPPIKKPNDRDVIPSYLGPNKKLFCFMCQKQLLPDKSCPTCGVFYTGQTAEHETKIRALDGKKPGPREMLSARTQTDWDNPKPKNKETKKDEFFESLEKYAGFRFTSYTRTDE